MDSSEDSQALLMSSARAERRKQVLLLGGWSPGPFSAIKWHYRSVCDFHEPRMYIPPAGCNWCFTWEWTGLCASIGFSAWLLSTRTPWGVSTGLLLLLASIPLGIVMLVRGSIRRSVLAARVVIAEMAASSSSSSSSLSDEGFDLVVGFSWGGGVACWLLDEGGWSGRTLLLAPTVFAMASASRQALPQFEVPRCHRRGVGNGGEAGLYAFCASADPFCPSGQVPYLRQRGAEVRVVRDAHVLDGAHTWEQIKRSFEELLEISGTDML